MHDVQVIYQSGEIMCYDCNMTISEHVILLCEVCDRLLCPQDKSKQEYEGYTICEKCNPRDALPIEEALAEDVPNYLKDKS